MRPEPSSRSASASPSAGRTRAFVEARVTGHPFFCEELLRAMLEAAVVRVDGGVCAVGDLAAVDLPTTVEGVIVSRLDRLTPAQQLCLKVASVIGRTFRERMVRRRTRLTVSVTRWAITSPRSPPSTSRRSRHRNRTSPTCSSTSSRATSRMNPCRSRSASHCTAPWPHGTNAPMPATSARTTPCSPITGRAPRIRPRRSITSRRRASRRCTPERFAKPSFSSPRHPARRERGDRRRATRRALWEKGLGRAHYYLGALDASRLHNERALVALHRQCRGPRTRGGGRPRRDRASGRPPAVSPPLPGRRAGEKPCSTRRSSVTKSSARRTTSRASRRSSSSTSPSRA